MTKIQRLLICCLLWYSGFAKAEIQPPTVQYESPVEYPAEALQIGKSGSVLLLLTINNNGAVTAAEVVESTSPEFDQSALRAIVLYQFNPSIDETDQPVDSQIYFRLTFEPEEIPPVVAKGIVKEAGIRKPLNDVQIIATNALGQKVSVVTNEKGYFELKGLNEGQWNLETKRIGLIREFAVVDIKKDSVVDVNFSLIRDQAETLLADDVIIVEAERESSEVSVKTLSAEQIQYLPGSNGDIVKAVQNLPGIARAPSGIGQLIIRGTAPEDSSFYIDGSPIPDVFHFAGLTTVLSTSNIENVRFLPGNYSVRYGRQLGGLVDIETKDTFPERAESFVSVDLYQSAFFIENLVKENVAIAISGRRSYADVLLAPVLNSLGVSFRLPRYFDFQTQVTWKTKSNGLIQGIFFLSDDKFSFTQPTEDEEEEEQISASYEKKFQQFQIKYNQPISSSWKSVTTIGGGPQRQDFIFDASGEAYEAFTAINLRHEFQKELTEEIGNAWKFGLDVNSGEFSFLYDLPSYEYEPESANLWYVSPAIYAEYRRRGKYADAIFGIRSDQYFLEAADTQIAFDPRVSSRFFITDSLRFIASTGLTSQSPLPRERSADNDGDPTLLPERSWQNSFGFQQELFILNGTFRWQAVGYYNYLYDLVVGREDRFQFFTGPPPIGPFDEGEYANAGTGFICGSEIELRYTAPTQIALISASFSHSERTGRDGESRLFIYDQPIVINALYSQLLPKNWRLGGRLRYGSGNPYTPVANRIYSLDQREFIPIYGERDSGRLPPFFSLDVRVDKEYTFRNWKLGTYLDIQNATSYSNVEIMSWSEDFSEETPIQGTPVFPVFGFKGEW
jgi:TonB family protein